MGTAVYSAATLCQHSAMGDTPERSVKPRIPIFLLTGFLGSGKTTLLNRLLREPAMAQTAVVVNEFGAIGLDQHLIAQVSDNVVLLESGCLCCTLGESLQETLADLQLRQRHGEIPPFKRVVIETTGLADPAPIMNTLLGHRLVTDHFALNSVVATADAENLLEQLAAHRETEKQLAVADRIVITKVDRVSAAKLSSVRSAILAANSTAKILQSQPESVAENAFALRDTHHVPAPNQSTGTYRYQPAPETRHAANIEAHCLWLTDSVSWENLATWQQYMINRFGDRMLRVKGLLRIADDEAIVFIQGVQRVFHRPERLTTWPDQDSRGRIVFIARDVAGTDFHSASKILCES